MDRPGRDYTSLSVAVLSRIDFLSYLYSGKLMESLNNLRFTLFSKKKDPPKIESLYLLLTMQQ